MKFLPVLVLLAVTSLQAQSMIQGGINLIYSSSVFPDNAFTKEFGNVVKVSTSWFATEFFGRQIVNAGVKVNNTGTKNMYYQYYVSFYDKDKKLLGCAAQGDFTDEGLKPGAMTELGSCLVSLPTEKYKEITSYQALLYEVEAPPKKPQTP